MSITIKTTSYALSEKGIHVFQDYATAWIYFCVGIPLWIAFTFLLSISFWIALVVAIPLSIMLSFAILRLDPVRNTFHKKRMITWNSVINAEMNKNKIRFILVEGTYQSGPHVKNEITVTIKNGKETETQQFLKKVLLEKFLVTD